MVDGLTGFSFAMRFCQSVLFPQMARLYSSITLCLSWQVFARFLRPKVYYMENHPQSPARQLCCIADRWEQNPKHIDHPRPQCAVFSVFAQLDHESFMSETIVGSSIKCRHAVLVQVGPCSTLFSANEDLLPSYNESFFCMEIVH